MSIFFSNGSLFIVDRVCIWLRRYIHSEFRCSSNKKMASVKEGMEFFVIYMYGYIAANISEMYREKMYKKDVFYAWDGSIKKSTQPPNLAALC